MSLKTYEWLKSTLKPPSEDITLFRVNRVWKPVAGFSVCGVVFCIYKDETSYCVHVGNDWFEDEKPFGGYYSLDLSWDDLLKQIADWYDITRERTHAIMEESSKRLPLFA